MHWRYCSIALNHQCLAPSNAFCFPHTPSFSTITHGSRRTELPKNYACSCDLFVVNHWLILPISLRFISLTQKYSYYSHSASGTTLGFCSLKWSLFIRPFEKRTYYAMAMSVRLSVRPSVRVFRTFFQHALRYQFETWYMHWVGDTTCRVWVSSQLGHFDLVYSQM